MTIMHRSAAPFWWKRELPKGVAYVYKDHTCADWIEVTYKEINQRKKAESESRISRKINHDITIVKPGYVWVFKVSGFLFGGWYIYIKVNNNDWGINFRHERNKDLVLKAMQLFPCRVIPDLENFDFWAQRFAKKYAHVGFKRSKNQGLVRCRCEIDAYGNLLNIFI